MCHSVRKSFMSALYGIYRDRRQIELNKTLADLGIDDIPDALLEVEKRARILDLLKARSGFTSGQASAMDCQPEPRGIWIRGPSDPRGFVVHRPRASAEPIRALRPGVRAVPLEELLAFLGQR